MKVAVAFKSFFQRIFFQSSLNFPRPMPSCRTHGSRDLHVQASDSKSQPLVSTVDMEIEDEIPSGQVFRVKVIRKCPYGFSFFPSLKSLSDGIPALDLDAGSGAHSGLWKRHPAILIIIVFVGGGSPLPLLLVI